MTPSQAPVACGGAGSPISLNSSRSHFWSPRSTASFRLHDAGMALQWLNICMIYEWYYDNCVTDFIVFGILLQHSLLRFTAYGYDWLRFESHQRLAPHLLWGDTVSSFVSYIGVTPLFLCFCVCIGDANVVCIRIVGRNHIACPYCFV